MKSENWKVKNEKVFENSYHLSLAGTEDIDAMAATTAKSDAVFLALDQLAQLALGTASGVDRVALFHKKTNVKKLSSTPH